MTEFLTTLILGLILSILGIINMTGNISTLHSYHRHRVSEENKKSFGKLVGIGTLIVGLCCIVFGVIQLAHEKTELAYLPIIGTAILIIGIVVGLGLKFYAMIKYTTGIF